MCGVVNDRVYAPGNKLTTIAFILTTISAVEGEGPSVEAAGESTA